MKHNDIALERAVSIVGFLFLLVAVITGFIFGGDDNSIIEYFADTDIVIPVVHLICAIVTFFLIFKTNHYIVICILLIESTITILTNNQELGIFFFYAALIFIMSKGLLKKRTKMITIILFCFHIITLVFTYPHGWKVLSISFGYSVFSMVFYTWIFYVLKTRFSCFFPQNVAKNETLANLKAGSILKLSDYNLNERQMTFVLENIHNKMTYKEISEKYYVSISTVKKIFTDVFKIFNVSNIEELRILLLQYQVQE